MSSNIPPAAPPAPPAQAPPPAGPPQAIPNSGQAIASMILGIVSFVLCLGFLTGIPAIILGHMSRGKIKRSNGQLGGGGMALTGLILGYITTAFTIIYLIFILVFAGAWLTAGTTEPDSDWGNDTTAPSWDSSDFEESFKKELEKGLKEEGLKSSDWDY